MSKYVEACCASPSAKSVIILEIILTTSKLFKFAKYHEDCANKKSPARIAILLLN